MKIEIRKKIYINLIICLVIILLVIIFAIVPLIGLTKNKSRTFQENQKELYLLKEKSKYLDGLKNDYELSKKELEKLNSMFLSENKIIDFITALENIASLTKNKQEIQISTGGKEEKDAMFFKISLWGDFPSLLHFLIYLENMDYLVEVRNLKIKALTESDIRREKLTETEIGDIESNIEIKVYTNKTQR